MRAHSVAVLVGAVLIVIAVSGCASSGQSGDRLQFTVEPVSSPATNVAAVRVTLRNTSGHTVTWDRIAFGVNAQALSKVATGTPDGVSIGITAPPGKFGVPLTLRSGEATSIVNSFGLGPGRWQVIAAYNGQGDAPSGKSKPIIVVVR